MAAQAIRIDERRAALAGLALALAASAALLLSLDSHLTFLADDWQLLVNRRGSGLGYFLDPSNGNIVLGPALLYKLLLALFGMGSALPFYLASIATFLASAVLLFVYLRRRVGEWLALIGAVSILFCGAAFEDLLFVFQVGYFASVAAGLGMLFALDRGDERGDRIACALLAVSLAFSSLGLAFAAAALADLALGRRPRTRRAYVALAPLALYALWWAGWGRGGESHLSLYNAEHLPGYVFSAAGAGLTSLLGLATGDGSELSQPHLVWGKLVLIAALAFGAYRVYRQGRISRGLGAALALGLGFWALAGLNHFAGRPPASSRYQYLSAVALLLIAAELLRCLRMPRPAVIGAAAVSGLAIWGGVALMQREYTERWRPAADLLRSQLAGADIAGSRAESAFQLPSAGGAPMPMPAYLASVASYGSPAFSEAELEATSEVDRAAADLTIAQAEGLALGAPRQAAATIACQTLRASAEGATGLTLLHGGFTLANKSRAPVEVLLSRFAEGLSVDLGSLPTGEKTALTIPTDNSTRPWSLGLRGTGAVRLCTATS